VGEVQLDAAMNLQAERLRSKCLSECSGKQVRVESFARSYVDLISICLLRSMSVRSGMDDEAQRPAGCIAGCMPRRLQGSGYQKVPI